MRKLNIEFRENDSPPFNPQFPIDQYGHPFTLNPTIGCYFTCKYCYAFKFTAKVKKLQRKHFFENVAVQLNMAEKLDK
jgi:DNA repair photolyase